MTKNALLIIDVQNGMFQEGNLVYKGESLLQTLTALIEKARSANTHVFYIQHNAPVGKLLESGTMMWEIHNAITPKSTDVIIQKTTPDSFFNTILEDELKKQGVDHVYLAGIQTEACVDTTCRRAFSMGYKVTLISDAHSTWDAEEITAQQIINHHNNVLSWFADVCPTNQLNFNKGSSL
ncbi:cysteine hydrolase family protein [Bacillus sp. FJAT-22090]|uniref:cysteine hydrolase family protein n=1 Tax=Bacillus sp. FJAT-22090 TaxID=1581038 RepID=UPI0011A05DCD|nr:cysteine hydrolase family protein [Bacillus sp. FJAT-22090]